MYLLICAFTILCLPAFDSVTRLNTVSRWSLVHGARPFAGIDQLQLQQAGSSAGILQHLPSGQLQATWQELVGVINDQGVPSNICPVVFTAPSRSDACSALQQQASQADGCVRLETTHSLTILLCLQFGNTAGTLLVYQAGPCSGCSTCTDPDHGCEAGGNIYRVRVSGPEILQPAVNYCGTVAAARFTITYPGTYHLQVLQLYQGFS